MKIKVLVTILIVILIITTSSFFFIANQKDKAKEIILEDVNALEKDIEIINTETEIVHFKLIYEMEFYFQNVKYEYAVNLLTMEIVNFEQGQNTKPNINNEDNKTITQEEAKKIALKDASVPSESVNNIIIEEDYDNGLLEYNIEFSFDKIRYEYKIDTKGKIVSFGKEKIK